MDPEHLRALADLERKARKEEQWWIECKRASEERELVVGQRCTMCGFLFDQELTGGCPHCCGDGR